MFIVKTISLALVATGIIMGLLLGGHEAGRREKQNDLDQCRQTALRLRREREFYKTRLQETSAAILMLLRKASTKPEDEEE